MKYLLHTNICIYLLNNQYDYLINKIKSIGIDEILISTITIAELEFGIAKSQRRKTNRLALMKFLLPFKFLDFTQNDSYEYGLLKHDLQMKGAVIGTMDLLIGAQAIANDLILVTNNMKEFERIDGIKIENWVVN